MHRACPRFLTAALLVTIVSSAAQATTQAPRTLTPSFTPTPTRTITRTCTPTRTGTSTQRPTPCNAAHKQRCVAVNTPVHRPTPCGAADMRIHYRCACVPCPDCPLGTVRDCPPQRECGCRCAAPTLSPTITATPSVTLTPSLTATPPPPSPTPTATPEPCPGDCNLDGVVDVTEIVRSVAIALGHTPPFACDVFGSLPIVDVVRVINAALRGCEAE